MPLRGRALRETAILRAFENLRVVLWDTNGHAARRPRALLADRNDDLLLPIILSGVGVLSHLRRELTLRAGTAVLMTAGEVGAMDFPGCTRFLGLRIPLRAIPVEAEEKFMRLIPARTRRCACLSAM